MQAVVDDSVVVVGVSQRRGEKSREGKGIGGRCAPAVLVGPQSPQSPPGRCDTAQVALYWVQFM